MRLKKRLAVFALAAMIGGAALLSWQESPPARDLPVAVAAAAVDVPPAAAPGTTRRIYSYSIVASGLSSRSELTHAVKADRMIAAHDASFDLSRAGTLAVAAPCDVDVSYRKGDRVYWTPRKLMLARGETLLSDGKSEILGPCGNRISDLPVTTVEARGPSQAELDSSVLQASAPDGSLVQTAAALDGRGDESGDVSNDKAGDQAGDGKLPGSQPRKLSASADNAEPAPGAAAPSRPGLSTQVVTATASVGGALPVVWLAPAIAGRGTATFGAGGNAPVAVLQTPAPAPGSQADAADKPAVLAATQADKDASPLSAAAGIVVGPAGMADLPPLPPEPSPWPSGLPIAVDRPAPASAKVPEPGSPWLIGLGFAGMLGLYRLARRAAPADR